MAGAESVILDLRRLTSITADEASGTLLAGAGCTLRDVQRAASQLGFEYGVDLASRDTATVGGTIATNAGGLRALRRGTTRDHVQAMTLVLADGTLASEDRRLLRDNTGYSLPSLACGSEGTLGVVTAARLRLIPHLPFRGAAIAAFPDVAAAVDASIELRGLGMVESVELMLDEGLSLVCQALNMRAPLSEAHGAYLLVEARADHGTVQADLTATLVQLPRVANLVVAQDASDVARLWRYREAHPEAIARRGVPHKLDINVPVDNVAPFIDNAAARLSCRWPGATTWMFGHVAEGNVHVNVTGVDPDDETVDDLIFTTAVAHGGGVSAEHGIGRAKLPWLHLVRSPAEISAMTAIKRALDPGQMMNPGVLLPYHSPDAGVAHSR
jgi:FAD/FMN-containing dehydrogenase